MKKLWVAFLVLLTKGVLWLRYRIEVKGWDKIDQRGGVLFLPNHPAEIDGVIVFTTLSNRFHPRSLMVERFFYLKGGHYLTKRAGCIPIPDMSEGVNKWKEKKVEKLFNYVVQQIRQGDNFLLYPAGKMKCTPEEIIGGASLVPRVLNACPGIPVVLMRITGLWGSRFSLALTGEFPDMIQVIKDGVKTAFKNGIFFVPRRRITIELELASHDFPYRGSRVEINKYLEKWYNKNGPESLNLVSELFWKKNMPAIRKKDLISNGANKIPFSKEEKEVLAYIIKLCEKSCGKAPGSIDRQMHLADDLCLDSFDMAQILSFLEEKFEVELSSMLNLRTVEDVLQAARRE